MKRVLKFIAPKWHLFRTGRGRVVQSFEPPKKVLVFGKRLPSSALSIHDKWWWWWHEASIIDGFKPYYTFLYTLEFTSADRRAQGVLEPPARRPAEIFEIVRRAGKNTPTSGSDAKTGSTPSEATQISTGNNNIYKIVSVLVFFSKQKNLLRSVFNLILTS
jgi:hypothetical protein